MTILPLFVAMLCGHALCDYALQSEWMARNKSRRTSDDTRCRWQYVLSAHALIHAGAVMAVTGRWELGLAEFLIHWLADFSKAEGWWGIDIDQSIHVACKVVWACVAVSVSWR